MNTSELFLEQDRAMSTQGDFVQAAPSVLNFCVDLKSVSIGLESPHVTKSDCHLGDC